MKTQRVKALKKLNKLTTQQLVNLSRTIFKPQRTLAQTLFLHFTLFEKWFNKKFGWFFTNGRKANERNYY